MLDQSLKHKMFVQAGHEITGAYLDVGNRNRGYQAVFSLHVKAGGGDKPVSTG